MQISRPSAKELTKGVVEASFTTPQHASFRELLDKAEVDWTPELTVRREMTASGRNRVFINDQMISLNLLKQLGEHLMQICGQHANQELRSPDKHRELLDTYGRLHDARQAFAEAWQKENRLRQELESLQREESQRVREMDEAQRQLEELAEAHLKEGEEEELFAEYTLLTSAEELSSGVGQVCETLTEASQLKSALHQLESLNRLDSTLKEAVEVFRSSLIEFDELAYTLRSYLGRIEHNPNRAEEINRRLALLTKLKKKYGPEPLAYLQQLEARIGELHGADDRAEKTSEALLLASELANQLAQELSQKRKDAANQLERELTDQLRTLNMPAVEFHVRMTPQNRNSQGDDEAVFLFAPNVGERLLAISDCASGGELARLMLALQALLAGNSGMPTLIFDEVDANIGGEMATLVGQKLADIGSVIQVLCVSHFPQVARHAHHHYYVAKETSQNRTTTQVVALKGNAREQELRRMIGGK